MNAFLDAIRDACAANAPDDARERGAQACQTLYAILSTPAGAPLVINVPPPPPLPIAAAASGKKGRAKSAVAAAVTAADLVALSDIAPPPVDIAQTATQSDVAHVAQAVTAHSNVAQTVAPPDIAPPAEPAPSSSDPTAQAVTLPSFDAMPAPPPTATPLPPAAAAAVSMISALRNMPPEQLMELAIARLRAALPAEVAASSPSVAPVRFHFIPLPRQGS